MRTLLIVFSIVGLVVSGSVPSTHAQDNRPKSKGQASKPAKAPVAPPPAAVPPPPPVPQTIKAEPHESPVKDIAPAPFKLDESPEALAQGQAIYERTCIWCHGGAGQGDGPAAFYLGRYSSPRPRDFTTENFKFRSTPSGELPTDQDLFRTVTQGIPGYMPSFIGLSEEQRWHVIAYVKSFNPAFKEAPPEPLTFGFPPFPSSDQSIHRGREIYRAYGCQNCHGVSGEGDGPASLAGDLLDSRGLRMKAADLTNRTSLKNGSQPLDLYRTIMTGLDGTPMPSYADQFAGKEKEAWHLVYYLLSLAPERRP
jgi:mono/diheme cytochrome c family protein